MKDSKPAAPSRRFGLNAIRARDTGEHLPSRSLCIYSFPEQLILSFEVLDHLSLKPAFQIPICASSFPGFKFMVKAHHQLTL